MYLESLCHDASCWVTLTYDDAHIDHENGLVPKHLQDWLKRFRLRYPSGAVRFFGVGEYGDTKQRPHYHVALFGVGLECENNVRDTWPFGFVTVLPLEQGSAAYIAKYTLKHMTFEDDWRLEGYHPEFMRCSNRPGIGAYAVAVIAEQLLSNLHWDIYKEKDVPRSLRLGRENLILGRYLRHKLRDEIGMTDEWREALKQEWVNDVDTEMFPLRLAARTSKEKSARQLLVEKNLGRIWSIEARSKLKLKRRL